MSEFEFRGFYVPMHMREGLIAYRDDHRPVGDFLRAVISNDLISAVGRADEENMGNLPAFTNWFYNHAPGGCWGSRKKYNEWVRI